MKMGLPVKKQDRVYTYADYLTWPYDERWELIDGVAWDMSPGPNRYHQALSRILTMQISAYLEDAECLLYAAPFDFVLLDSPDQDEMESRTVVQPDISVICDRSKLTHRGCTGAPDWIIEIISPYTSRKDLIEKLELYERHSVREYWTVDPGNKFVHIYVADINGKYPKDPVLVLQDGIAEPTVLSGLRIEMSDLFSAE